MDEYSLINSKSIQEHCRKIKHKFNTEELMVLIFRNKRLSVDEKIAYYNELINNYPDMEVIKRFNCEHYDNVKTLIQKEIDRINITIEKFNKNENNIVYFYNCYCEKEDRVIEWSTDRNRMYSSKDKVIKAIEKEIKEDGEKEITSFKIVKQYIDSDQEDYAPYINAEFLLDENRRPKMVHIMHINDINSDINGICLDIPTPFKKGDLLIGYSQSPFWGTSILNYEKFPFVVDHLVMWNDNFKKRLEKGNYDSSDMQAASYKISEDKLCGGNVFDYDSWEYWTAPLDGMNRFLKATSNMLKGEIDPCLYIDAYDTFKAELNKEKAYLQSNYTKKGLELVGFEK